jgi:hypothetical protein
LTAPRCSCCTVAGNALDTSNSDKFFSISENISAAEGVTVNELDSISGYRKERRVTKK